MRPASALGFLLLVGSLGFGGRGASPPQVASGPAQGFLKLADQDFDRLRVEAGDAWLQADGHEGFRGLALDGPRTVRDAVDGLRIPLAGFRSVAFADLHRFPFREHTALLGLCLADGAAAVTLPFLPDRPYVRARGGEKVSGEGVSLDSGFTDAAEKLNLPWKTGDYVFWLLSRQWVSNPVHLHLELSKRTPPSTEPVSVAPSLPASARPLPQRTPLGVTVSALPRRSPQAPDRLAITYLLKNPVSAALPLTLVAVGRSGELPTVWRIDAPGLAADSKLPPSGSFTVELPLEKGPKGARAVRFVTAILGEVASEPLRLPER